MNKHEEKFQQLRELAEQTIQPNSQNFSEEMTLLLHELQVYQVELEIQNEELRQAQDSLITSKEKYTDLFDYAPISYLIIDEDGMIAQANLTAVTKFETTRRAIQGIPFGLLVAPDNRDAYYLHYRKFINTHESQKIELWFSFNGSQRFYGSVESVIMDSNEDGYILRVAITDITDRKHYENRLQSILKVNQGILNKDTIPDIIETAIDSLASIVPYEHIHVILFDKKQPDTRSKIYTANSYQHVDNDPIQYEQIKSMSTDSHKIFIKPQFFHRKIVNQFPVHLIVPITENDVIKGFVDIGARNDSFTSEQINTVKEFALQLGIAIYQADMSERLHEYALNLEKQVEERTNQLFETQQQEHKQRLFAEIMLSIVKQINQPVELETIFEHILHTLESIIPYDFATIMIVDDNCNFHIAKARHTTDTTATYDDVSQYSVEDYPIYLKMKRTLDAVIIDDMGKTSQVDDFVTGYKSYLGIPIHVSHKLLGFINIFKTQANVFSQKDATHLQSFAEHASAAIDKSRLYRQAQELALMEERQRLARELHDIVSQRIFALHITAETLPKLLNDDRTDKAKEVSDMILELATGAHTEMRLLLVELSPMILNQTQLDKLIHQLVKGYIGHQSIDFKVDLQPISYLGVEIKNALFRIAQQALNNIVNYSKAHHASIQLWELDNCIHLKITDDGFDIRDANDNTSRRIQDMQDRAKTIGAELDIDSGHEQGTTVYLKYLRH